MSGGGIRAFGGTVAAGGDIYAGMSTADALDAQAQLAADQGNEAEAAGQYNVVRQQRGAGLIMGRATANFGASGVAATGASAVAIMGASAANSEFDRLNLLHQADLRATNYRNQEIIDKNGAKAALTGSIFKAVGAIVGGYFGGPSGAALGGEGGGILADAANGPAQTNPNYEDTGASNRSPGQSYVGSDYSGHNSSYSGFNYNDNYTG